MNTFLFRCVMICPLLALAACATVPPNSSATPAALAPATPVLERFPLVGAEQLILVTAHDWNSPRGELHRFERVGRHWQEVGTGFPVNLGRNGLGWGLGLHRERDIAAGPRKREGDGRSPAGAFAIGPAFGYGPDAKTGLSYLPMTAEHYCIDVPTSPLYNRIVDARQVGQDAVAGSTEPMRLDVHHDDDDRYAQGFVIEHNPDAVPQGGSCIFAHLWRDPAETTSGCTAMPQVRMAEVLEWLDASRHPVFVLLPESDYQRLAPDWRLPVVELMQ